MYPLDFWPKNNQHFTNNSVKHAWAFLDALQITYDTKGITWLELLILYQARGGPSDLSYKNDSPLTARSTLKQLLNNFKALIKLVTKYFMHQEDQYMIKPARTQCYRLRDAAIQTHMSRIACQVVVTPNERQTILHAILQQKGRFTQAMQSSLLEQTLVLPSSKLSLRQLPKWKLPPPSLPSALRLPRDPDKQNDDRGRSKQNDNTFKAAQIFFC